MNGPDKRERIIEAAIEIFIKRGFAAASVQEIAAAAGVAKGTVYLYFESKEDLIAQVYAHCLEMDREACNVGLTEEKGAVDKLCRRLDNIMDFAMNHPREAQIENLYLTEKKYGGKENRIQEKLYADIEAVIREGIARGELRAMPVFLLGRIYYGLAATLYLTLLERGEPWHGSEIRSQCHRLVRDCLTAEREGEHERSDRL